MQYKKLRIIVDLDCIIVNFFKGLWEAYENKTGEVGNTDLVTEWDIGKFVNDSDALYECMFTPGFFAGLEPLSGSISALKRLHEAGHEIVIATTPCTPHSAAEKISWCAEHLPFLDQKKVFIGHSKYMISGDVLIDDNPENAAKFKEHQPNALTVTISYPYNIHDPSIYSYIAHHHNFTEIAWEQLFNVIEHHAINNGVPVAAEPIF